MNRELHKLTNSLLLATAATLSWPSLAVEPVGVGESAGSDRYRLHNVDANMSEGEYRRAYRNNRGQIQNFIEDYSESSLTALGIPRKGVHLIGAAAGAAITQDATFYINKSKFLAIEVKDAAETDRAVLFGFKVDW